MVAKAVGGVLFVGLIGTGGIAVAKPHWLGMDYMPEFQTLSTDSDYNTYSDNNHFGKKYGKYLVGVTKTNNKTDKNKSFWEWAFRQMSKEIEKGKFSTKGPDAKIDKGFSEKTTGDKALNQICKEAYKKKEDEFHNGTGTDDGTKFNKSDVWKYCSPIGQKPTTVQKYDRQGSDATNKKYENGTGGEKIGKKQETSLISVFDKGNDVFWNMRDKEIKDKSLSIEESHNFFKKAREANTHIKDVCKEAYGKPSTVTDGTPSPSDTETKKYCSLEATA